METIWITQQQLAKALVRHEAFWQGELAEYPIMWVTVPDAMPGEPPVEPDDDQKIWTDVEYVITAAEYRLSHTYFAADSLPVFNPWLGPDQFVGWLGAELQLKPRDYTSWSKPFVDDWDNFPTFEIRSENRYWKLYLDTLRASIHAGRGKWITTYPDLHSGIDALGAMRGPEQLMIDMVTNPEPIHRAMRQMTDLWKQVVEHVSPIILPAGQGTSNWTMGWSSKRFLCIGQNDFSCLLSPDMFTEFCWQDTRQTCEHVDRTMYHLDGPDALRHLPKLLELEALDAIQWIQGAGNPLPSTSLDHLRRIQNAGKSVQVFYGGAHGGDADVFREIDILCNGLDPRKLFFWIITESPQKADALVEHARRVCRQKM